MADTKSLGPAIIWSDEELDNLAEITEEDIQRVNVRWRSEAPKWARNLLLADQPENKKNADSSVN